MEGLLMTSGVTNHERGHHDDDETRKNTKIGLVSLFLGVTNSDVLRPSFIVHYQRQR